MVVGGRRIIVYNLVTVWWYNRGAYHNNMHGNENRDFFFLVFFGGLPERCRRLKTCNIYIHG